MKKTVLLIVAVSVATALFYLWASSRGIEKTPKSTAETPQQKLSSISPKPTFIPPEGFTTGEYKVDWIVVRDLKKIDLYSNLEEKLTSREAIVKNGCLYLISGGFWTEEGNNLGLLVTNGQVLSQVQESKLADGFLSIDTVGLATISKNPPEIESARLALQSGPIIFSAGHALPIESSNDYARRVVVATTDENEVVFIVVYAKSSPLLGPKLSDLPSVLNELQKNTNLELEEALNLDGGTHSAFITDIKNLTEVANFGSYFCILP